MAEVLEPIPQSNHPDLLVGFNKADDAGVFRINDTTALVQTVDFFPPIVDDPYSFGQIAAANALSDVYAMGGKPLTALSIVGFPGNLPASILSDILRGGTDKIEEAEAVVVGGHSIKDKELKYGVSITGVVHPDKIVINASAQVGDSIYLTKPLGTGLITTGIKRDVVESDLIEQVIKLMSALNKDAAEIMVKHNVSSATDITGFGLLGHAYEMAKASNVSIKIDTAQLPLLPQVLDLAEQGMIPGGANANREFMEKKFSIVNNIDSNLEKVLFDPQTSGGLFIAIPETNCSAFENEMTEKNVFYKKIGITLARDKFALVIE